MEYIAGETLTEKIVHKKLRLPQTLKFAAQIADALACAHASGVVHRDLKPSNIMIGEDGIVKVLDFGLAKLSPAARQDEEATATMAKTGPGIVLGTTGYMSPEQVRGGEIDHRSDIFNFGLVLYEMLAGRRAFQGRSVIEVMSAIANEEPVELPDIVPAALRQIVADCLEKEPAARFESARDLAFALRAFAPASSTSAAIAGIDLVVRGPGRRWLLPAALAVAAALAMLSAALYITRPEPLDLWGYKFRPFATDAESESLSSWSRDGKSITYLKAIDGQAQVMVRNLNTPSPTQLTRLPSGVYYSAPFFSPDGDRVCFIASGALWSVAVVGGEPSEVLRAPLVGAAMSGDGKTLAFWQRYEEGGTQYGGVWISSPPGAPPRKYQPAPFRVQSAYIPDYLRFSPDGSRIGLAVYRQPGEAWVWILPWPDGPNTRPRQVFRTYSFRTVPSFDWTPDSRHICVSANGRDLWFNTRNDKLQRLTASPVGSATQPAVSPDGQRILFTASISDFDVIELPIDGSPPRLVLATAQNEMSPTWSAAGDQMAFITDRSGESEIWLRNPSGWERPVVRQTDFPNDPDQVFECATLSPDGSRIAYIRHGKLWISAVSGGRVSQAVATGEGETGAPSWSPEAPQSPTSVRAAAKRRLPFCGWVASSPNSSYPRQRINVRRLRPGRQTDAGLYAAGTTKRCWSCRQMARSGASYPVRCRQRPTNSFWSGLGTRQQSIWRLRCSQRPGSMRSMSRRGDHAT